jgi:hypothetical protein
VAKLVLHIGTHKTATTTIQDTFWANAPLMAEHGLIYPQLSAITGHHGLVPNWSHMPPVYAYPEGPAGALQRLVRDHADSDATVFLSSEEFSRASALDGLAGMRRILEPFERIEIVCTLRIQWQFLQSVYLELGKKTSPPRPPKLVDPVIETGMFQKLWVDYNGLLDQLEAVFAPDEITFFDFDTIRKADGGVLGTFLRHLGCPLTTSDLAPVNEGASNVSPLSLAGWAANILAEPQIAPDWLVDLATTAIHAEYGARVRPCLFTRDEFTRLARHFTARNAALEARRARHQPGFALTPASAEGLTLFRHEISSACWVLITRAMVKDRIAAEQKVARKPVKVRKAV